MVTCDISGRIVDFQIQEGKGDLLEMENDETGTITLRKIYLWNQTSNRRTCGLAWDNGRPISTLQCAQAILSRWGASENTFKHLYDRHPFHYHPGFKTVDSEKQLITNPAIKSIDKEIKDVRKKLDKKHKENSRAREVLNKDGSIRENSLKVRLETKITGLKAEYAELLNKKKQLPEKVDVSTLENYRSFHIVFSVMQLNCTVINMINVCIKLRIFINFSCSG
ncbi:MAG: hypothetical protein ACKVE4_05425 [Dissulfuribacterales bacterium]